MKLAIKSSKIFSGPSIYARFPVILFSFSESITLQEQRVTEKIWDLIESILPELDHYTGTSGVMVEGWQNGGSDIRTSRDLFRHLCLALQGAAGIELSCVRAQQISSRLREDEAIVPYGLYEDPDICLHAAQLAIELIAIAESESLDASELENVEVQLKEFRGFARARRLKKQDYAFIYAALANGIPVRRLVGRLLVLGHGQYQQRINEAKIGLINVVSHDIAKNKDYTRRILSTIGLKVPCYKQVSTGKEAVNAAKQLGYPIVIKPNNASNGKGITVGIYDRDEVREAYKIAREVDRTVLIEEFIEGNEYRLLVLNGKFHSALKCLPSHVVGNGFHSIDQLVMQFNNQSRSETNHSSMRAILSLDEVADDLLLIQGYDHLSVPAKDVIVYLRRNASLSAGGMAYDVTENVHPEYRMIAERATRAIGLEFATVNFLTTDIAKSVQDSNGKINGVSSCLGDILHLWNDLDKTGEVQRTIMSMLFPSDRLGGIPIVAVTGMGDTSHTAKTLTDILTKAGRKVGLVLGNCTYVSNETVLTDVSLPDAIRAVLLDPDVDIAVLELKPNDVLSHGLDSSFFNHTVIIGQAESERNQDTSDTLELDALRVVACATLNTIYAFENDGFSIPIEHGGTIPRVCRIRTDISAPKPVVSSAPSKFWSTLTSIGLKAKDSKEDQQANVHEDFVLFGGLSLEQVESLRSRLFSLATATDKENMLRVIFVAHAVAVELGIEPALIYRVLSEFNFD
ncbi:MAG: ATP-grasp domain-containing protein [Nitrosomonas sp.]|nr:MAG: ATP-grasp domain-containing protein [Nitrosomonas sp.]